MLINYPCRFDFDDAIDRGIRLGPPMPTHRAEPGLVVVAMAVVYDFPVGRADRRHRDEFGRRALAVDDAPSARIRAPVPPDLIQYGERIARCIHMWRHSLPRAGVIHNHSRIRTWR
jgi:hypothetical protein